jgi:addiction module HigA family antidote
MLPTHRAPTHPGEILAEEFLAPLAMTQLKLASKMGVPVQRVNLLVNGKRGVTAETALLLAKVLKTSALFWMNLQVAWDLWAAQTAAARARSAAHFSRHRRPA